MIYLNIPSSDSYLSTEIDRGQLPAFLEKAMLVSDHPQQCDMLLLSTLTACSYALPHIKMLHGYPQHTYYPNLMTLIVAPPAGGKGVMNNARLLLQPIQDRLQLRDQLACIPANSSSAAFLTLLQQNGGKGYMMETEMDVLSHIWKSDYGNYSYLFRQSFEHESILQARKGPQGGYTRIDNPQLSVLLSGTPNQLAPLIGSQDNGLASRFLPYIVEDITPFDRRSFLHGNRYEENGAQAVFRELGGQLFRFWSWLSKQDHDCLWCLTDEQAEVIGDFFDDGYRLAFEHLQMPVTFDATVKRMAVIVKRIGLVLSALRFMEENMAVEKDNSSLFTLHSSLPSVLYCSDEDFQTLMLLAEKLLLHAGKMVLMLGNSEQGQIKSEEGTETAEDNAQHLLSLLPDRFTTAEAKEKGKEIEIAPRSVMRYLTQMVEEKTIVKLQKGSYKKI